jgi:hypothetical protein
MKGIRTWLVCWARIFLTAHFFTLFIPIAQQPGQAVVLGRLSLCLLWAETLPLFLYCKKGLRFSGSQPG